MKKKNKPISGNTLYSQPVRALNLPPKQTIKMPCLECGKLKEVDLDSNEANGVFNVFCPNGDCEDRYASKL